MRLLMPRLLLLSITSQTLLISILVSLPVSGFLIMAVDMTIQFSRLTDLFLLELSVRRIDASSQLRELAQALLLALPMAPNIFKERSLNVLMDRLLTHPSL